MKVNVKIAHSLLETVKDKAGVSLNHAGLEVLSERINAVIKGPVFNQKYLYYNLLKKIEKYEDQPQALIGLNANYLHALAQYIGFDDFFHFQKTLIDPGGSDEGEDSLRVWYVARRFHPFNIWRNPDLGRLFTDEEGEVCFHGETELKISQVDRVRPVAMPGDGGSYWLRVDYSDKTGSHTAYFSNARHPGSHLRPGPVHPVHDFFRQLNVSH